MNLILRKLCRAPHTKDIQATFLMKSLNKCISKLLMRKVLLVIEILIIDDGFYRPTPKEPSIETVSSSFHLAVISELYKNFDKYVSIVVLRLPLLVNNYILHISVLGALLLYFFLQLFVNILASNHVFKTQHLALPADSPCTPH